VTISTLGRRSIVPFSRASGPVRVLSAGAPPYPRHPIYAVRCAHCFDTGTPSGAGPAPLPPPRGYLITSPHSYLCVVDVRGAFSPPPVASSRDAPEPRGRHAGIGGSMPPRPDPHVTGRKQRTPKAGSSSGGWRRWKGPAARSEARTVGRGHIGDRTRRSSGRAPEETQTRRRGGLSATPPSGIQFFGWLGRYLALLPEQRAEGDQRHA
jgi:hypothetical protein